MKKRITLFLILAVLLCGCSVDVVLGPPEPSSASTVSSGGSLSVHFLDVGQADCALLECGGEYLLIDGGNREDSQLVVSYLEQCGVERLRAVVCTHAHEDHVGGLPAVLAVYPTDQVFAPTNTYSSKIFDSFVRYTDQQGLEITIPSPGDCFRLGDAAVTVLGPVMSYAETNNTSIVLMVQFGDTRFLFTGDMETAAENDMMDYWEAKGALDIGADVLKVGHHGSSTSSGYRFLYEVNPDYAIVPCETGNSYGHPHREIISRYHDAGVPLFRADKLGTILAVSDGQTITITWENQNEAPDEVEAADSRLIGNRNSKVFHSAACSALPKEKNRVYFETYRQAVDQGYTPCSSCLG